MEPILAIYPGSFDPVTNGHLDLIGRGARIFDRLIVAILHNAEKSPLFTVGERAEMLREVTAPFRNVEVDCFHGLLVEYAVGLDEAGTARCCCQDSVEAVSSAKPTQETDSPQKQGYFDDH